MVKQNTLVTEQLLSAYKLQPLSCIRQMFVNLFRLVCTGLLTLVITTEQWSLRSLEGTLQ